MKWINKILCLFGFHKKVCIKHISGKIIKICKYCYKEL